MRITSFCAILALLFITQATAQVKIGDNPQSIDGASILELESNSRVFVVTRVNTAQMNAITPLRGALLYNTDEGCVFYYNGASWVNLCSEQNTTNVSLSLVDDDLVLTDSDGNSVSVTLEGVGVQTFTSDPVVNGQATIVITQTGDNFNFEVSQITGDNIVDGSINGFLDIQFNSISADQLAPNSVGQEELQDNTVGDLEIDYGQVTVSDFSNDAGYLTAANLVSTDVPNSLTTGTDGGVLYDDSALQTSINDHIANDGDLDDQNELITSAVLDGSNNLVINQPGGNITVPLNSLNNAGSDDQQLSLAGNILTLEDGGTVDLSGFAGTGTDDQQLSLAGNILTLEDGGTVDLSGFAGTGTDDQTLTLLGNEITIEDGNTIDLTPILGGGADGVVTNVQLNGSDLEFTGTAPGFNGTVDLSSLAGGGADGVVTDVQLNGTDLEFTGTAPGFNATVDLSSLADDQNAAEVPFTPYLSLGAIDTQAAIEELKDEVDAIVVGGGGNPIDELQDLQLTGDILTVTNPATPGNQVDLSPYLDNQNAAEVPYDNTTSGLTATDTQAAIDEIAASVIVDTDDQTVDEFQIVADQLSISLQDDGVAPSTVDLSPYLDNTDNQTADLVPYDNTTSGLTATDTQAAIDEIAASGIVDTDDQTVDEFQIVADQLSISLQDDGAAPSTVDLSPYLDNTDNQTADLVPYDNTTSGLTATDTQAAIDEIAASGIVDTDDQTVDEFQIVADQLTISLQDDGVAPSTVDLSPYLDNTDNQTADLVPYDNTTSGLTATDTQAAIDEIAASGIVDTDDQTVDEFQIVADQLTISLQDDGVAPSTVDLSPYLDNTDNQTADLVPYDNTTSGLTATDTQAAIDEIAASGIVDTDDQTVDEFQIVADQLSISLQDDGAAPSTVDLSPYLDNTDNQTADLVPYDNTTSGLTATDTQAAIDEIAGASGSQNLFDAVDALTANITHDLGGFDFVLGGSGNVGIGSLPGAPASQLDVNGQIRGRSGIAAGGGSVNLPDYAFHTGDDMDTGMYRPGPDQIGFSTGGTNALTIDAAQEVTIAQNLDLDGDVLDFNDVTGTVGQVLSSRGAGNGVEWINAAAIAPAIQYSIPFYNAAGNDLQEAIHPTKSTQSFYWDQSARFNTGALFIGVDDGAQNTDAKVQIVEDLPTALAYPLVIQNRTNVDTGGGAVGLLFSAERVGSFGKGALVYERNASFGRGDFHFLQEPNGDGNDPDLGDAALTIKNDGDVGIGTSNPTANLHTAGSFAANIRSDAALNVVIGDNDYTVIVDSATDIDLPAANSAQGRIYIIKNVTGVAITMSADSFVPSTSTTPTSTLQIGVTQLQSDGTNWQQIN